MNIKRFLKLCTRSKIAHIKRIVKKYNNAIFSHPVVSNSIITGAFMAAGDAVSQKLLEEAPYSKIRTINMGIVGGVVVGPLLVGFYKFMELVAGKGRPLVKLAMDQAIFTPFITPTLILIIDLAEGKSLAESERHIRQETWPMLKASYYVWPFIQAVNFTFVPFNYRIIVVQVVALIWNTYLAWALHVEIEERKRQRQLKLQNKWWRKKPKVEPTSRVE